MRPGPGHRSISFHVFLLLWAEISHPRFWRAVFHKGKEMCLLMDIGTNGEVALGNQDGIYATSTAAGPAFEGAEIKRGMAGVPGAVNSIFIREGKN